MLQLVCDLRYFYITHHIDTNTQTWHTFEALKLVLFTYYTPTFSVHLSLGNKLHFYL